MRTLKPIVITTVIMIRISNIVDDGDNDFFNNSNRSNNYNNRSDNYNTVVLSYPCYCYHHLITSTKISTKQQYH